MTPARTTRGVDPFDFEIIRHKLFHVTEEAAIALENASGTSTTTEGHDLMVSLYDENGTLMVGGAGFLQHITSASQAVKYVLSRFSESPGFDEDDVYLFNDPYKGALHAPDVYLIAPIHWEARMLGFVAGFVHVHDIGGIDPGGFCPRARSSFEEGFASPGIKLVEHGSIRLDVYETILNMVRDASIVALDLKSLLAAMHVAKERMHSIYCRYGAKAVAAVSSALVEQSEQLLRQRLMELPDGCWHARSYYEQPDKVMRIHLAMTKRADSLTFDFSGTDEQVSSAVNCSYWATWGSVLASIFVLLVPDLVWNDGILAPITLTAEEGTLVNARKPAPLSLATIAMVQTVRNLSVLVISKMLGASQRFRDRATGTWAPTHVTYHLSEGSGGRTQQGTDVFAGSGGASAGRDGLDLGGQIQALASRWANVERHEAAFPYLYLYRRLVPDSGGPGRRRGGLSHEYAVTPHHSSAPVEAAVMPGRGDEASLSHGIFGGYPGCNTATIRFSDSNKADWPYDLASTSGRETHRLGMGITKLNDNDILYIRHDGAGGYGDPLEREPDGVLEDVIAGLITAETALMVYGVVLDDQMRLDAPETRAQRLACRRKRVGDDGLPGSVVARQPIKLTGRRISEYLQTRESGDGPIIECLWCGRTLCHAKEHWKDHAIMRRSSPRIAGSRRVERGRFFLLEFFCPGCGTSLEVENIFEDDPPLHDVITRWGRAAIHG